jgi:histidine triad (HIT) family protein
LTPEDFYCEEEPERARADQQGAETDNVLAFRHTRPFRPVHIVVVPKRHIASLLALEPGDDRLPIEIFDDVKNLAAQVVDERGGARILTNLGDYQDSKHLHFHINFGNPLR